MCKESIEYAAAQKAGQKAQELSELRDLIIAHKQRIAILSR